MENVKFYKKFWESLWLISKKNFEEIFSEEILKVVI